MKALRIIGNIVIGIILFTLIFSLSFVKSTKSFFEKDLIIGLVKNGIIETLDKEANKIDDNQKIVINEIFNDEMADDVVHIVIDNYKKYQENKKDFSISDSDLEILTTFALKHKNEIVKISNDKEEITDEKVREIFSKENVNKIANEIYGNLSKDVSNEVDLAFDIYNNVTSNEVMYITIGAIILLIVILGLINWSVYKWMITTGVCLIISGILMCLFYLGFLFINEIINSVDWLNKILGSIDTSIYIIIGGIEFVVGIILVVIYNSFKNKPFNEQIDRLGVGE